MTFPRRQLEPVVQRVHARIGKRIILDTTHTHLLFEDERHPWRAIPKDALLAPLAGPASRRQPRRHASRPGRPAPGTPRPLTAPPSPASLSSATTSPTNGWKKNTRSNGMPKNPYHRVDALPSGRHIQVLAKRRAAGYYPPPGTHHRDRRATPLVHSARRRPMGPAQPSPHHTTCQYKGQACYWTGRRHQPAATGVKLPRTAARGEPGRAHRHSR